MPAKMFPKNPDFGSNPESSKEYKMYEILRDGLTEEYYVFYSFPVIHSSGDGMEDRELDFLVFHAKKGLLYIEAKNGRVQCTNGGWTYANGTPMKHNNPYQQARSGIHSLMGKIKDLNKSVCDNCPFGYAVWLYGYDEGSFKLPDDDYEKKTLYRNTNVKSKIDDIFKEIHRECRLSLESINWLFRRVLAQTVKVDLISVAQADHEHEIAVFEEMKREQVRLLDYLEEQPSAIINGCAGSGKTVMAIEKALRNAEKGEKTLFLCYNAKLKDYLQKTIHNENIDVFNIDGWIAKHFDQDYNSALEKLDSYATEGNCTKFPYSHIVVDEGQDFENERAEVLLYLKTIIDLQNKERDRSSFFLFYDKNQLVQAKDVPEVIKDADCKLTLYCNCRNTTSIAKFLHNLLSIASVKLSQKNGKLIEGNLPVMFFATDPNEIKKKLDWVIRDFRSKNDPAGNRSIQILTALDERENVDVSTEMNSCLAEYIECDKSTQEYTYFIDGEKIPFSTCRKFKGLEADCVIVVDVCQKSLEKEQCLGREKSLLYVGASRARSSLYMFMRMSPEECADLSNKNWQNHAPKAGKYIAKRYNCNSIE
jgi:hypothetical protein